MEICADCKEGVLYLRLCGEVDEHNAAMARRDADKLAESFAPRTNRAVIDLKSVSFMDSTGIGFLIGRYKKLKQQKPDLVVAICGCMTQQKDRVEVFKEKYKFVNYYVRKK